MICRMYRVFFFFQAEDGIRDLVRSRGLGDVYKRQVRWYASVFLLDGLGLFPNKSLVENIGHDGSGTHLSLIHI